MIEIQRSELALIIPNCIVMQLENRDLSVPVDTILSSAREIKVDFMPNNFHFKREIEIVFRMCSTHG